MAKPRGKIWFLVIGLVFVACLAALYISVQHNDPAVVELRKLAIGSKFERSRDPEWSFSVPPAGKDMPSTYVYETLYFSSQPAAIQAHIGRLFASRVAQKSTNTGETLYTMAAGDKVVVVLCIWGLFRDSEWPQEAISCVVVAHEPNGFDEALLRRGG